MDAKKTNLTPELKEIYDRVMNASGKPSPISPSQAAPPLAQNPSIQSAQPLPQSTPPSTSGPIVSPFGGSDLNTRPMTNLNIPEGLTAPSTSMPSLPDIQTPGNAMPTMVAPNMTTAPLTTAADQALSSVPPRPVNEGNTFSFNGTSKQEAPAPTSPGAMVATKKKSKISKPILIILGLAFIIVWGIFWAIIMGIIKR